MKVFVLYTNYLNNAFSLHIKIPFSTFSIFSGCLQGLRDMRSSSLQLLSGLLINSYIQTWGSSHSLWTLLESLSIPRSRPGIRSLHGIASILSVNFPMFSLERLIVSIPSAPSSFGVLVFFLF